VHVRGKQAGYDFDIVGGPWGKGVQAELKTLDSAKKCQNQLESGLKQAKIVFVDGREVGLTPDDALEAIRYAERNGLFNKNNTEHVMILTGNKATCSWRRAASGGK